MESIVKRASQTVDTRSPLSRMNRMASIGSETPPLGVNLGDRTTVPFWQHGHTTISASVEYLPLSQRLTVICRSCLVSTIPSPSSQRSHLFICEQHAPSLLHRGSYHQHSRATSTRERLGESISGLCCHMKLPQRLLADYCTFPASPMSRTSSLLHNLADEVPDASQQALHHA